MLKPYGQLVDLSDSKLELVELGVSQTFEVGDVVESYTNGVADNGAAAKPLLGVIQGFTNSKGVPLRDSEIVAGTASGVTQRSVTTDATNSDGYYALVETSKFKLWSAEVSGTLGTTNDSDLRGCWLDINSAGAEYGQLLETTASRTAHNATSGMCNFYSHGKDPNDATRLIVSIANHEFDTQIDVTP